MLTAQNNNGDADEAFTLSFLSRSGRLAGLRSTLGVKSKYVLFIVLSCHLCKFHLFMCRRVVNVANRLLVNLSRLKAMRTFSAFRRVQLELFVPSSSSPENQLLFASTEALWIKCSLTKFLANKITYTYPIHTNMWYRFALGSARSIQLAINRWLCALFIGILYCFSNQLVGKGGMIYCNPREMWSDVNTIDNTISSIANWRRKCLRKNNTPRMFNVNSTKSTWQNQIQEGLVSQELWKNTWETKTTSKGEIHVGEILIQQRRIIRR